MRNTQSQHPLRFLIAAGYAFGAILGGLLLAKAALSITPENIGVLMFSQALGIAWIVADILGRRFHDARLHIHGLPFWLVGVILIVLGYLGWFLRS